VVPGASFDVDELIAEFLERNVAVRITGADNSEQFTFTESTNSLSELYNVKIATLQSPPILGELASTVLRNCSRSSGIEIAVVRGSHSTVGIAVGVAVGATVGVSEGADVGDVLGSPVVGTSVGLAVGASVGTLVVGTAVGAWVGGTYLSTQVSVYPA